MIQTRSKTRPYGLPVDLSTDKTGGPLFATVHYLLIDQFPIFGRYWPSPISLPGVLIAKCSITRLERSYLACCQPASRLARIRQAEVCRLGSTRISLGRDVGSVNKNISSLQHHSCSLLCVPYSRVYPVCTYLVWLAGSRYNGTFPTCLPRTLCWSLLHWMAIATAFFQTRWRPRHTPVRPRRVISAPEQFFSDVALSSRSLAI